jgi:hypothetical protein
MNLIPNIDLSSIVPIAALAAIAAVCIIALLLRSLLHSRIALLIAVVAGVVIAGPTLGGTFAAIFNSLAIVLIVCAGATLAALLIIRSHPDLRDLARDALSLVPRQSAIVTPPLSQTGEVGRGSITVIDQPQTTPRTRTHRVNGGSDWGF